MPRDVDERKKRKALRKLRKAAELAEAGLGPPLSDWEREFLEEVEERIEKYGSAFADPNKGNLEDPLSALQARKLKEIDKKARGKSKGGFKRGNGFKSKNPMPKRGRDIHDDVEETPPAQHVPPSVPAIVPPRPVAKTPSATPAAPKKRKTGWAPRIIDGGKD